MFWKRLLGHLKLTNGSSEVVRAKVMFNGDTLRIEGLSLEAVRRASLILSGGEYSGWKECSRALTYSDFMALVGYYYANRYDLEQSEEYSDMRNHLNLAQMGLLEPSKLLPLWSITLKGVRIVRAFMGETFDDQKVVVQWGFYPWPLLISAQFRRYFGSEDPIHLYGISVEKLTSGWTPIDKIAEEHKDLFPFIFEVVERAKFDYSVRFMVFPEKGTPSREMYRNYLEKDAQDGS